MTIRKLITIASAGMLVTSCGDEASIDVAETEEPTELIAAWAEENEKCMGAAQMGQEDPASCDRAGKLGEQLSDAGYCYGDTESPRSNWQWLPCSENSEKFAGGSDSSGPEENFGDDNQLSNAATLSAKADKWQGCSLIASTVAAMALREENYPIVKDRMQAAIIFNNIATFLLVETGAPEGAAREQLKGRRYAESRWIEEGARNNGIITDVNGLFNADKQCSNEFRKIQNEDFDTLHVIQNYEISKGTEKFQ